MLFPADTWDGLRDGSITVAFRSWKRPTVKAGGTLITPAGQLAIDAVEVIDEGDVTDADARASGAADAAAVLRGARLEPGRRLHRIRFHRLGDDPRLALRASDELSPDDVAALQARLARMDARSADGPWTRAVLDAIVAQPEVVSTELAAALGQERETFKIRVRKLKGLGLTESLGVGYRISPRGAALLAALDADEDTNG